MFHLKTLSQAAINAFMSIRIEERRYQCISDRLPVEVLETIFMEACIDGGYTGCSLSRVSRASREIARTCRFHSVSLHSEIPEKVARFLACLTAERSRATGVPPKVRHLYLTSARRLRRKQDDPQERFNVDVSALMDLVAPDLYTLHLLNEPRESWDSLEVELPPTIGHRGFPELRELTVIGRGVGFGTDPFFGRRRESDSPMPPVPHLTHLHVMSTDMWDSYDWDLRRWAERSPGVTHLRLTHLTWVGADRVADLRNLAGVDVEGQPIFQNLELLIIQPCTRPPRGGKCGTNSMQYGGFLSQLYKLHDISPQRVGLGPVPKEDRPKDLRRTTRQEWLARLNGGRGCWRVDDAWFKNKDDVLPNET